MHSLQLFQTNPALILAGTTSFKPALHQSSIRKWLEEIQKSEHLFPWKACKIQTLLTPNLMAYLYLKKINEVYGLEIEVQCIQYCHF